MKNDCSISNLLTGGIAVLRNVAMCVLGVLAFLGAFSLMIVVVSHLNGRATGFRDDLTSRVLYVVMGLSLVAVLWKALASNWRAVLFGSCTVVGIFAVAGGSLWYANWVTTQLPAIVANPLAVFSPGHVPLVVRLEMIPAQFVVFIICIAILVFGCAMAWFALTSMCEYGAKIREAKAAKNKAVPVPSI